jgi:hypothetical protein
MTDLFWLPRVQMRRIERYFPLSHGIARVDDRRIVSAIVFVIKNGLRCHRSFESAPSWAGTIFSLHVVTHHKTRMGDSK